MELQCVGQATRVRTQELDLKEAVKQPDFV